jgi:hypothetical protein
MKPEKTGGIAAFLKKVKTDRLKQLLGEVKSELDSREPPKKVSDMDEKEFHAEVEKYFKKPTKEDASNESR